MRVTNASSSCRLDLSARICSNNIGKYTEWVENRYREVIEWVQSGYRAVTGYRESTEYLLGWGGYRPKSAKVPK